MTRPVDRGFASQMKSWERLVGTILTQVLEESEEEEAKQGREGIILNDSRVFVREIERINEQWRQENARGEKWEDSVDVETWDIAAMYPSLKIAYIVKEIDTSLCERIQQKQGEDKEKARALREIVMPLLIFMLEHQFVYVTSEGLEGEEKIFYWQKEGIGIGSSASGAIANLTLVGGERIMLGKLKEEGHMILLYKRYMDDIFAVIENKKGAALGATTKCMEEKLNALDEEGKSVKVEGKGFRIQRTRVKGAKNQGVEFLDIYNHATWDEEGGIHMETGIFRKEAAADMYILESSAHPTSLKNGMMKGECIRYLTRCSTEKKFDRAWNRFEKALIGRGYKKKEISKARKDVQWKDRDRINRAMDDRASKKRQDKKRSTGQVGGKEEVVMMVVPDKGGVSEWWMAQKRKGVVGSMAGISQEVKKRLPGKMMLGRSSTPTLGKIVKRPAQSKGVGKGDTTGQE